MNARIESINTRGWIAVGAAFVALLIPFALTLVGIAHYDLQRSSDDPLRPADSGAIQRICLFVEWMAPGCLLVWVAAQLRVRNAHLFEAPNTGGRVVPLGFGAAGLALIVTKWLCWGPSAGQYFTALDGWQFGFGWFLTWWCFVFVRLNRTT